MTSAILHGICAALIGFALSGIVANQNSPLSFWFDFLFRLEKKAPWIAKPLGACAFCFSGQVALWSALLAMAWNITPHTFAYIATATGTAVTVAYFLNKNL